MMDNDFNPYDLLQALAEHCDTLHRNGIELASAHNKQARALEELAKQHRELIDLNTETRKEVARLRSLLRHHELIYHHEAE